MKKLLLSTLFLLLALTMAAQDEPSLRPVKTVGGLSNNFVLSMAFDGGGCVWVGTEAGLNRIAGKTVTQWRREQIGLANEKIQSLYYDADGDRMLIGTELGLISYSLREARFSTLLQKENAEQYNLAHITSNYRQGAWLIYSNGKILQLDCTTSQATRFADLRSGLRCGMDDQQGHLYIGHSKDGLSVISQKNPKRVKRFTHRHGDNSSLPGNNVRCLRKDSHGRIWVGTDRGVALYNPVSETFTLINDGDNGHSFHGNVFDICEMTDGSIWVACDVGGIHIIDPLTTRLQQRQPLRTSSMNTRCLLQDSYHNIWIGNHSTGVDFLADQPNFLQLLDYFDKHNRPRPVYGVTNDAGGRIWVSSENELSLWVMDSHSTLPTLQQKGYWQVEGMKHRKHSFARCLMADSKGYVWMGMEDEGVIRFNTHTNRFESIDIGFDVCDIHSFYEDVDGCVWIGAELGVCIYEKGKARQVPAVSELVNQAPVTSFLRVNTDELLLTSQGRGVTIVNTRTMTARHLTMQDGLPTNNINQAMADSKKGLWLATYEGLVYIANPQKLSEFQVFGTDYGLSEHQVRAICQDEQGRIWASTYSGIDCFDPAAQRFYHYNQQGDVNIGGFMEGSAAKAANGSIVFGSPDGTYYLMPDKTETNQQVAGVKVTVAQAYTPTENGNESLVIIPDEDGDIQLNYQQNTLRLAYTVADYALVDDVEYSYMIKGLNDQWYYNGSDYDIMFRSLRPGRYTFILRAKLKSQDWDEAATTQLNIHIRPPFWLSWWAFALYALLAMALLWWVLRQYKRRMALRNSLEMTRRESLQKQELNEERLRFFTNITHELRTPLTLILGPLEDLSIDTTLSNSSRKKLELVTKNAHRLRDLVNEILEFRKTETQNRRLTVARGNLGQFVREQVLNFKELNRNPQVIVVDKISPSLPDIYFDSEVITTILSNLLSNAQKYTERGSITVRVALDDGDTVSISVSDTGYGIAAEALPHIFDRYYQAEGGHQASGTGIGLALVKSLADLHEAELAVESIEGQGSRFTLRLQVSNTYPNALHKEDKTDEKLAEATDQQHKADTTDELEQQPLLLIVEDNDDIRQYIADSLGDDFRILQAGNGVEGVEVAQEHIPDIIVSDIMMPKMNGIQLTRILKDDIRTSHIPVILLTAKDTDDDKEEGYDSGADSYLTKPFTAKLLASRIRNLLTIRRRLAEQLLANSHEPTANSPRPIANNPLDRSFIVKLNQLISENIMQTDIDMAFLTDKMAMSHSTFYRKVKALTGLTAKEYVRKMRLRHCYQLLQSGQYNVTEAAMMTGFNQMAHFREVFKQEFGILPSELTKKQNH